MCDSTDIARGHKFGNFHSYYSFHEQKTRTKLIPDSFFLSLWRAQGQPRKFTLLDVGCNEGNLTAEIYERAISELPAHVECFMLGVDLDDALIDRAIQKNKHGLGISFQTVDIMSVDSGSGISIISDFCASRDLRGFSFISLFSITMWIHLNHGDSGLDKFLVDSARLLTNVGSILVEPQPWKCYRNAVRRCRKMSLPLPLHFSDLLYKDPDAAVCACMARAGRIDSEVKKCTSSSTQTSLGITGCGLNFYSPLGTEVWGRSLLVFHSFDVTAATPCDFKVLHLAQGVKVALDEVEVISQVAISTISDLTSSSSLLAATLTEAICDDSAILNSETGQHLGHNDNEVSEGNRKRKSTPPDSA